MKKNAFLGLGPLLLLLLSLSACRAVRSMPESDLQGASQDYFKRYLAMGFDTQSLQTFQPCLEDNFHYSGTPVGEISYLRNMGYQQLVDLSTGGLYGKASLFGLVKADARGEMAATLATTDDTASFIYQFEVSGKTAVLNERRLNKHGNDIVASRNFAYFRERCGNQFIESVNLGAQLFIGVKYSFTSTEKKEEIRLKLSAELFWGLIKLSKTWSKEWRDLLKNVRVDVEAFQVGGDPAKLKALKDSLHQGSCGGDDAERCAEVMDRLMEYGRSEFPKQLDGMQYSKDPNKGPAILDVVSVNYRSQKVYFPNSDKLLSIQIEPVVSTAEEIAAAINRIQALKIQLNIALQRSKTLQEFSLSNEERSNITAAASELNATLQSIESGTERICKEALMDTSLLRDCTSEVTRSEMAVKEKIKPLSVSSMQ